MKDYIISTKGLVKTFNVLVLSIAITPYTSPAYAEWVGEDVSGRETVIDAGWTVREGYTVEVGYEGS